MRKQSPKNHSLDLVSGQLSPVAGAEQLICPIRMETALALLPLWLPSKHGYRNIVLRLFGAAGKATQFWAVTFNETFGPPRELAYDLDTLIIALCFDQIGRPLPSVIPLGSMRDICRQLGLTINGKNLRNIRKAFSQNVGATITADIEYTSLDGSKRRLNSVFSRYAVVYRGDELPDGRIADCVYIVLHPIYQAVLNNTRFRPLDYDYLRQLRVVPRRFYEIISFQMFSALKNKRPEAKIHYSLFCAYTAQVRSFDSSYVSTQMRRVHKPHLDSKYIASVRSEMVRDTSGNPDWIFYYTPGPRAINEFNLFNGKKAARADGQPEHDNLEEILVEAIEADSPSPTDLVRRFHSLTRNQANHKPLTRELKQAQGLLESHGPVKSKFIVEFAARRAKETKFKVQQFGGLFVYLAEAEAAYDAYLTSIARTRQAEDQRLTATEIEAEYQDSYDLARARAVEMLAGMGDAEAAALGKKAESLINERSPSMKRNLDEQRFREAVRGVMLQILTQRLIDPDVRKGD